MTRQTHGRPRQYDRSLWSRLTGGRHRSPIDLSFSTPFGRFKIDRYTGRTHPLALLATFLLLFGGLGLWLLVVSLGAVFGLFGLIGPSVLESLAVIVVVSFFGHTFRE